MYVLFVDLCFAFIAHFKDTIQLGACREGEFLPQHPDLPADIFTSCLTTPIQMSLLWYIVKTNSKSTYSLDIVDDIPGVLTDRRTMLGELNWIYTAITDTIAWNALNTDDFQRLFRQVSRSVSWRPDVCYCCHTSLKVIKLRITGLADRLVVPQLLTR